MDGSSKAESSNTSSAVGQIKRVVVLMFENRAFDHILGAMPGVNGLLDGNGVVKPDIYNTMSPTEEPGDDNQKTTPTAVVPYLTWDPADPVETKYVQHDFNHEFGNGMSQDLFGPGTTGVIGGRPQGSPAVTYPATNSGFLSTIAYNVSSTTNNGTGALCYFEWKSMRVLHTLAESFVVCDAWHCDMPGHTAPNRAFMHCATTGDLGIDDDDNPPTDGVKRKSVFETIQDAGQTWKMYSANPTHYDISWLNQKVRCQKYDKRHPDATNVSPVPMEQFFKDADTGDLPFYSFLMCWNLNSQRDKDTSMHPASLVEPAENMLAAVYNALRQSPQWGETLLVVNFDENGGMYDHVAVPQATPPDVGAPVITWYSSETCQTYSFDFSVLGPRIPVLLISPWLNAGVCNTQYQNTSILRFLQDMLPTGAAGEPYYLTERDRTAPTIAPVFEYGQFGRQQMRSDCPDKLKGYGDLDPRVWFLSDVTLDAAALAAPPAPHLVRVTKSYIGTLPAHPDSGKPITRTFATVGELRDYAQDRLESAQATCRQGTVDI